MKIKGSHGGNPYTHLRNLLFLFFVAECSITLQENIAAVFQVVYTPMEITYTRLFIRFYESLEGPLLKKKQQIPRYYEIINS